MRKLTSLRSYFVAFASAAVIGGSVQAQNFIPVPLTSNSFTYEIVIPASWPFKPNAQNVTVTIDNGPTLGGNVNAGGTNFYPFLQGNTMFEIGLDRASATASNNSGMPHGGTFLTNVTVPDHVYVLPYWTNMSSNCLFIGNYPNPPAYTTNVVNFSYIGKDYTSGNLAVTDPTLYTGISLLSATGNGTMAALLNVSHADGTVEQFSINMLDWFNSAVSNASTSFAYSAQGRLNVSTGSGFGNIGAVSGCRVYSTDIGLSDTTSPITNLNFVYGGPNGRTAFYAVSGTVNPTAANGGTANVLTGPFSPLANISGFNAGSVVPSPETNYTLPYNATMDSGTNYQNGGGGGNTWFEMGWDPESTNGFPVHGSTFASFSNPNRKYQMAPTYSVPMSTLIDTNHQLNNITPITPIALTAVSFLTAGANNGTFPMTNYCILQHSDGVNETNVFLGYDWFNNSVPYAWIANGRANFNNGWEVVNNDSGDPRLFESTFQTTDPTPITNMVVGFQQSQGASSTTFILGVSGTTNFVVINLGNSSGSTNVFAGQSASFSTSVTLGSQPKYQWQLVKGGVTNNLSNGLQGSGSTIFGANAATLLVSNVGPADAGLYTAQVTNLAPSIANSPYASLGLLTSPASLITQPGDPITGFYTAPGSVDNGAVNGAGFAIDGTLTPYYTFGGGAFGGPFLGPVGFVVTPNVGNSTITAARIYTSTNAVADNPADFTLYGSVDGVHWNFITTSALSLPPVANATSGNVTSNGSTMQEIDFANSVGYFSYAVYFTNTVGGASATNGIEMAEVQLLGTLTQRQPGILQQPGPTNQPLVAGGSVTWSVVANGVSPFTYQWFRVASGATNSVTGATNASFTLANATASSGSYYVAVSNSFGGTNSVLVGVTIAASTSAYENTVLADNPIGFWRLDEGPDNGAGNDGVTAVDIYGGHDGYYSNVVLHQTGPSTNDTDNFSAQFGVLVDPNITSTNQGSQSLPQDDLVAGINGINFATSGTTNFSVEAWVNLFGNVAGGGIVTKGFGGGGEEFALDTGGTGNAFRFYTRNTADAATAVSPSTTPLLNAWHHVVGVYSGTSNMEYIYVDGLQVGSTTVSSNSGILATNNQPITIGSRQSTATTNYNLQLQGFVANVAIYGTALNGNQVLSHYLSSGQQPFFFVNTTNETVDLGQPAPAVFTAEADGSAPVTYQWYFNGAPITGSTLSTGAHVSGATTSNLTVSAFTTADNGDVFTVTAKNTYGSANSPAIGSVSLFVASGPPTVIADISPLNSIGAIGTPLALSVNVQGTAPLTYNWYQNGSLVASGTSSTYTTNYLLGTNNYYATVSNSISGVVSSTTTNVGIAGFPPLTFPTTGSNGWTIDDTSAVGSPVPAGSNILGNGHLTLTYNLGSETRTAWYNTKQDDSQFVCSFTYQDLTPGTGGADGVTFTIQNDTRGLAAIGGGGGGFAYTGVTPSVALVLNIYHGATASANLLADTVMYSANGTTPATAPPQQATAPVVLDNGNPINVVIFYNGVTATSTLTDTVTHNTTTISENVNIPASVGNPAYIGFTAADGGAQATQTIYNFSFANGVLPPPLSVSSSGTNVTLSWPSSSSTRFTLQSKTNLLSSWTNVPGGLQGQGSSIQYTTPISTNASGVFYRLQFQ